MDYCPLCCKKLEKCGDTKRCANPGCPCDVLVGHSMTMQDTFSVSALIKLRESG
jgi:hypothetical protein